MIPYGRRHCLALRWIYPKISSYLYVFVSWCVAESITQLPGSGECVAPYGRPTSHLAAAGMVYNDGYKDIAARYYYYYPQCSPDVIATHGLHQHHHHHHQQQQGLLQALHPHGDPGVVATPFHPGENGGGDSGDHAIPGGRLAAVDGYGGGETVIPGGVGGGPPGLRYYGCLLYTSDAADE